MGTRASALARAQSGAAADELTRRTGVEVEVVIVRTEGDQLSSEGKAPPGGDRTGVFTRALDDALRARRIDFAIHSLKDVPTEPQPDLLLAAVPPRADTRDALVVATRHPDADSVARLPRGAVVATSSPRRVAQLLRLRADLSCVAMAGNVDTRLARLEEGRADAILLACAGLDRLGRAEVITRRLPYDEMLPAPGQGALAIVCRADDDFARRTLAVLDSAAARTTAEAERQLLNSLRGGCRAPVGARADLEDETLRLTARVLSLDGRESLEVSDAAGVEGAVELGRRLAERLLSMGAQRLIEHARGTIDDGSPNPSNARGSGG